MQFKSVLLAASALASFAFAASTSEASSVSATTTYAVASGCSFETATATVSSDLDQYTSCSALEGDLLLEGDALSSASLSGVKAIYGNLIITNATQITSFSASSLATVTGKISLTGLTRLATLDLSALTTVGSIYFVTLPALDSITLTTGVTEINSLYISDTALESLDGFEVSSLDTFNVNNNKNLATISASLQSVKTALEVSYNSDEVQVSFEDLVWANNITFRDVSSVSLNALEKVNSSLVFISNSVTEIDIPLLASIGGSLSITNNDALENFDFSNLTSIGGGFQISNNTELESIDGFDSLQTVGGAIIFEGNFSNASLPSLKKVSGGVTIESSGDLNCDSFNALDKKNVIQGDSYVCKGASTSVSAHGSSTAESDGSSSAGSSGSSKTASGTTGASANSEGSAAGFIVPSGTLLAFIGSFVYALL